MSSFDSPTAVALACTTLSGLARFAPSSTRTARSLALADLALFAAGALVLTRASDPHSWTTAVLGAPPLGDPRLVASLALALAVDLACVPLIGLLAAAGASLVSTLAVGAAGATMVTAAVAFAGLRGNLPVSSVALAGFGATVALVGIVRLPRAAGGRLGATLALGMAGIAIASALTFCGARSEIVQVPSGGSVDTLGYSLSYRGRRQVSPRETRLDVTLLRGRERIETHPGLVRDAAGQVSPDPSGGAFSGPIVIAVGVHDARPDPHPIVWLAKGDSIAIAGSVIRFDRFRIQGGDTVRIYADLSVTRGGTTEVVSPGVTATAHGEEPFPTDVAGLGKVMVAGIDADHGRVALLIPGAAAVGPTVASLSLGLRPALPLAWAGLALSTIALLTAIPWPRKRTG